MSAVSNEPEKRLQVGQPVSDSKPRTFRKLFITAGSVAAILLVAFSLGVGLGLGLHKHTGSSTAIANSTAPSAVTTSSPGSTPTSTGVAWQPAVSTTFNYQLSVLPTSDNPYGIAVWFIDLFASTADLITGLQKNGAKVVCYFSAGSSEDWRPDFSQFTASDLGANLTGWQGERWLNTNSTTVRAVMSARMDQAVTKKCDGIDPDNMDAYDNEGGGLNLTEDDAANYGRWLASEASSRNLAIGLKNAAAIIPQVIDVMQWSVNEQCINLTECDTFSAFIKAGKPVFNIEYPKGDDVNNNDAIPEAQLNQICNQQNNDDEGFSTILKNMKLDTWIEFCNGTSAVLT